MRTSPFGPGVGWAALALAATVSGYGASRPNVLIVMPDDLSYGDFSATNAAGPRTPNIDGLGRESVRLTDFHVSPTCSPSRASVMTGRYNDATGVWHTIKGRELLRADEVTMPQVFAANGYRTAIVSKWHLGSAYPFRPEDRGFEYTAVIHGGGADQQPDYWGDSNLPPSTYFVDGRPVRLTDEHEGIPGAFSTNFFTDRAIEFMRGCAGRETPFFLYLAYNVAHVPDDRPPDARPGIDAHTATVENLDKNVGRLLAFLRGSRLADNTILLFFTDNGMASDLLRAGKASEYEGGHRVPCFIRWKAGGLGGDGSGGRDMPRLCSHIDLLPTLMDLARLHDVSQRPAEVPIQGHSLRAALEDDAAAGRSWWDRTLVVDNQRQDSLEKYREACVMRDETDATGRIVHKWRLIEPAPGRSWELYDLLGDVKETTDLAGEPGQAAVVAALKAAYESWWDDVSARKDEYSRVVLGTRAEPRICLYTHDWHNESGDAGVPWNQGMVAAGLTLNGFNAVQFSRSGAWRFELRRWPEEIAGETSLDSVLRRPIPHGYGNGDRPTLGVALPIRSARIRIWNGGTVYADRREEVDPKADCARFAIPDLPSGPAMIQTWFYGPAGENFGGADYDTVEFVHP